MKIVKEKESAKSSSVLWEFWSVRIARRKVILLMIPVLIVLSIAALLGMGWAVRNYFSTNMAWHIFLAPLVLMLLSVFMRVLFANLISDMMTTDIGTAVHRHVLNMDAKFYDNNSWTNLISSLMVDLEWITNAMAPFIISVARSSVSVLTGMIMMFFVSPVGASIVFIALLVTVLSYQYFKTKFAKGSAYKLYEKAERLVMQSFAATCKNATIIQSLTAEKQQMVRFDNTLLASLSKARVRYAVLNSARVVIAVCMVFTIVFSMVAFVSYGMQQQQIDWGVPATFLFATMVFLGGLMGAGELWQAFQRLCSVTISIREFLSCKPSISNISSPVVIKHASVISLNGIDFSYQDKLEHVHNVFEGFSFAFKPNQWTAITGPSGSGKSTLLKLLVRFYDVSSGCVTIDGEDIRRLDINSMRHVIGIALQDSYFMTGRLIDNLVMGMEQVPEESAISELLTDLGLADLLDHEDGIYMQMNEQVQFSGGQKQRLSIARLLLRQSSILLFDEPTSALDKGTQDRLVYAIKKHAEGRTCIISTHNSYLLSQCQNELKLEKLAQ